MTKGSDNSLRSLSIILYLVGLLLVLAVAIIAIWPDLEASLFDRGLSSEETLRTLNCPLVISPNEETAITATFHNRLERNIRFLVRARISLGGVLRIREAEGVVALAPGESEELRWPIEAGDAAFGRLILARVYVPRGGAELPSRQAACGVLVMGVPLLTGTQFVALLAIAGIVSLAAGIYLWLRTGQGSVGKKRTGGRTFGLLAFLIVGAMVAGLLGSWMAGGFLLVLSVLLLVVIFEQLLVSVY